MADTPAVNPRRVCNPCAFNRHDECAHTVQVMEPDTDPYRERTRMIWNQYPCSCEEANHGR